MVLPPEVLEIVFKNLCTINDIISCKKVCTIWKSVIGVMFKDKGKFLLISQKGHDILDLLNPSAKYEILASNVPRIHRATGGLLQKVPIICGGNNDKSVVVIGQPEMEIKMLEKRIFPASVALNQRNLWIVGGYCIKASTESSTEFIELGQPSVKGPDMPFTIHSHSMIQYDEETIYIIGGVQNNSLSNKTWIVDPKNGFQVREGPSLNEERYKHCCVKMTLNGRTILVVAGGFGNVHTGMSIYRLHFLKYSNFYFT